MCNHLCCKKCRCLKVPLCKYINQSHQLRDTTILHFNQMHRLANKQGWTEMKAIIRKILARNNRLTIILSRFQRRKIEFAAKLE